VLAAEVAGAEAAVTDDALRSVAAVLETAADLLGRAAADGQREVDCGLAGDGVGGQRRGWVGEVLAGVDEAEGGCWEVGPESQEGVQGCDCGGFGDGYGEGWRIVSFELGGFGEEGGSDVLTVAGEVLHEDLHGLFGLGGGCARGSGGDAGDAVGAHDGG
jgi:hypothetical protein